MQDRNNSLDTDNEKKPKKAEPRMSKEDYLVIIKSANRIDDRITAISFCKEALEDYPQAYIFLDELASAYLAECRFEEGLAAATA